jgi:hypothetical protein
VFKFCSCLLVIPGPILYFVSLTRWPRQTYTEWEEANALSHA